MALQSAAFDPTDPMQQVRRRMVNRMSGAGLEPSLGPDLPPAPIASPDFATPQPPNPPPPIPGGGGDAIDRPPHWIGPAVRPGPPGPPIVVGDGSSGTGGGFIGPGGGSSGTGGGKINPGGFGSPDLIGPPVGDRSLGHYWTSTPGGFSGLNSPGGAETVPAWQQTPLPEPIPGIPGAGLPTFPATPIPGPVDLAPPLETPKITAGPVAKQPLGPDTTTPAASNWNPVPGFEGDVKTGKPYADVQGFNLGKIQDPTHQNPKYTAALRTFSQAISGLDPNTDVPRALAYIQNNGFPQAKMVGDRIDFGDGNGPIDVTVDSGKGGWWFQNGPDRFGGGAGAPAAPSASPTAPQADVGNVYTPTNIPGMQANAANAGGVVDPNANHPGTGSTEAEWATSKVLSGEWTQEQANQYLGQSNGGGGTGGVGTGDFLGRVRDQLMQRITEAGQPVDENATGISQATSAARDEAARATQGERSALAERLYAQGGGSLNSNALTQQIQQSGETNARNLSTLRSGMIVKEYARKQQQLTSMLNMALASGDAEMARNTQMQLAQLNARVQREGLGVDLAKFLAALNQQSFLAGLGG